MSVNTAKADYRSSLAPAGRLKHEAGGHPRTLVLRLVFKCIAALSLGTVHAIGGALGTVVFWLSPTYRRRVRANLAQAGYDDPALVRAAAAEAGKQALETAWIWMRPRADIIARTEVADMSIVDRPSPMAGR